MIPKFRAWIIAEKRHLPVTLIDFYDKIVWCRDENNPTVKVDINQVYNFDEIILEQWTGLKDKNGTEIYEGSKINVLGNDLQVVIKKGTCFVKGQCRDKITNDLIDWFKYLHNINELVLVTGHIHESEAK